MPAPCSPSQSCARCCFGILVRSWFWFCCYFVCLLLCLMVTVLQLFLGFGGRCWKLVLCHPGCFMVQGCLVTCAQSQANLWPDGLHTLRAPCCCAWPVTSTGGEAASVAHCLPSAPSTRYTRSGNLPACNRQRCIDQHGRGTVRRTRNYVVPQACPWEASQQLPSPQSDPGAAGHPRPAGLVQQPKPDQGMHAKWAAAQPRSDQSWLGNEPGIYACWAGRWFFCAMHALLGIQSDQIDSA